MHPWEALLATSRHKVAGSAHGAEYVPNLALQGRNGQSAAGSGVRLQVGGGHKPESLRCSRRL